MDGLSQKQGFLLLIVRLLCDYWIPTDECCCAAWDMEENGYGITNVYVSLRFSKADKERNRIVSNDFKKMYSKRVYT